MIRLFPAVLLQVSGILGAGIFVLPYVFYQSNFSFAAFGLFFVYLLISQINLFYAKIIQSTPGDHQLPGYAQIYLGTTAKYFAIINLLLLELGALIAYIILSHKFLSHIIPVFPDFVSLLIFFILVTYFHLNRLNSLGKYHQVVPFIIVFSVIVLYFSSLSFDNAPIDMAKPSWLFFGPFVFALTSFNIIPEVEELLRPHKKYLKLVTIIGLSIATIIYLVFSLSVYRLSGYLPTPDAVTGVSLRSPFLATILSILGFILVFQAALNQLLVFKEAFYRDFRLSQPTAYVVSLIVFALCFLFYKFPLVDIISLTGSITLFASAAIICTIRLKISTNIITIIRTILILSAFLFASLS